MPTLYLLEQNDVELPLTSAYEGRLWFIYYTDTGLLYSDTDPQGCIFTANGAPPNFSITLPDSAPTCPRAIVAHQHTDPSLEWVDFFTIENAPPEPEPGGWTRRLINLPFRRRRPAPRVQP